MTTQDTLQEQANAIRLLRQDRDKLRQEAMRQLAVQVSLENELEKLRQELAQEKEANLRELAMLRQVAIRVRDEAQARFEELTKIKAEYYSETLASTRELIKAREELAASKALNANDNKIIASLTKDLLESEDALIACKREKDELIAKLVASTGRLENALKDRQERVAYLEESVSRLEVQVHVLRTGGKS